MSMGLINMGIIRQEAVKNESFLQPLFYGLGKKEQNEQTERDFLYADFGIYVRCTS